jgi:uncharacterized protein YoxC
MKAYTLTHSLIHKWRVAQRVSVEEQVEERVKQLLLDQQYALYSLQELNKTYHMSTSLLHKKIQVMSEAVAELRHSHEQHYSHTTSAVTNLTQQIELINNFKLIKIQNVFQKEIDRVAHSLQSLHSDIPVAVSESESKLLARIDKHNSSLRRLLKYRDKKVVQ